MVRKGSFCRPSYTCELFRVRWKFRSTFRSEKRKCRPCSQKNRLCHFGHVRPPTVQSIITGSIPLGACIACLASGGRDACVAIAGGTGDLGTSPLKWYGPLRASFMSDVLGSEDYAISLVTARATNGKTIKGQFHDSGPLMMVSTSFIVRESPCPV